MRAWIGCLASYNNGRLIGEWFDVSTDEDENAANIAKVLRSSPYPNATKTDPDTGEEYATAEEAFIADYDETPRALVTLLGEYPGAKALADAARLMERLGDQWPEDEDQAAALSVMLDGAATKDLEDLADDFEDWISDHFAGEADTLADWCAEHLDETGFFDFTTPGAGPDINRDRLETLKRYFDYESYARDLQLGGDVSTERGAGKLLIFWNR